MKALVAALMAWIGAHTDYPVADMAPPEVRILSPQALEDELTVEGTGARPSFGIELRLFGLYSRVDGTNGTIFILDPGNFEGAADFPDPTGNPRFREALLHELVHHAQYASHADAKWPCPTYGEHEAMRLGGIYLFQQGVADPIQFRSQLAAMMAGC